MFGRRPRTQTPAQDLQELAAVYESGYRGMIFIVDDNFIGNKKEVKKLLAALIEWNAHTATLSSSVPRPRSISPTTKNY